MKSFFPRRLWIITGAEGFLGNTLVRELLRRGERVRACTFANDNPASLFGLDCERVPVDVTRPDSLDRAFAHSRKVNAIVVHCAGVVSIASKVSAATRAVNVRGTQNVVAAVERNAVKRLVYVSSVHAIPEPADNRRIVELEDVAEFDPVLVTGEYAKTKTEATRAVLDATQLWRVVVHPSGMIGPGDFADTHLTRLVRDTASGDLSAVVDGGYDFVDVRDVAAGIISAATRGTSGRSYILSGHFARVGDMVRTVARLAGQSRRIGTLPMWLAKATAPLAELYYRVRGTSPLYTRYSLHTLRAPANFSHARAQRELGFSVRPLVETLRDTVTWLRQHPAIRHA